mgnify:CR=1 FL=1
MEEIMKSKKIVALVMSAAMVVGAASMFAACKPEKDGPGGTTGPEFQVDNEVYHCAGSSFRSGCKSQATFDPKRYASL